MNWRKLLRIAAGVSLAFIAFIFFILSTMVFCAGQGMLLNQISFLIAFCLLLVVAAAKYNTKNTFFLGSVAIFQNFLLLFYLLIGIGLIEFSACMNLGNHLPFFLFLISLIPTSHLITENQELSKKQK